MLPLKILDETINLGREDLMNIGFIAPQIDQRKGGIEKWGFLFAEHFPDVTGFRSFCAGDSERISKNIDFIFLRNYTCN